MSPVEIAFQAHLTTWGLDGPPRTARRYTTDRNCPLPTPADRRLCILISLKTSPLQVMPGRLFGMGQRTAHQWIQVLLGVWQATRRALGDAPTRSVTELAKRLGVTEVDANTLVVPVQEPPSPSAPTSAQAPASSPLLGTMAPNGAIGRPQDPTEQTRDESGKNKCHTVKTVRLINAMLTILFLSETSEGRTHDKRRAEATPDP